MLRSHSNHSFLTFHACVFMVFAICSINFSVRICTKIFVFTVHTFILHFPNELIFYIFLKYIHLMRLGSSVGIFWYKIPVKYPMLFN